MSGTLYLVGTPIGNLEDISLRALRILRQVPLVAAEDTRVTGRLLARYKIETRLTSYHEHSKLAKLEELLEHLATSDLALVSDAGMPGLSDPGYELVKAAVERGFSVVPVPGPSAIVVALAVSGLPTDSFVYLGFLPRRAIDRRHLLNSLRTERRTLVAFETPHRLMASLAEIERVLGERSIAVGRELTKLHEEIVRGTPAALLCHFADHPPKGEITLVIEGWIEPGSEPWDDRQVAAAIAERLSSGESPASAAKAVSKLAGRSRQEVYRLTIQGSARLHPAHGEEEG